MAKGHSEWVATSADVAKAPAPVLPEFALCGRSNVGKSSLLNLITGRRSLAKVSATPGKTRLLHHYKVDGTWLLCDLPGYGYAKVGHEQRNAFARLIFDYLENRPNLLTVFMLVDSRLKPQELDLEFANKVGQLGLPLGVIFTKTDKLGVTALQKNVDTFRAALLENWEEAPPFFFTSALNRKGQETVLDYIEEACTHFVPPILPSVEPENKPQPEVY
jgi:GTP-binding protein